MSEQVTPKEQYDIKKQERDTRREQQSHIAGGNGGKKSLGIAVAIIVVIALGSWLAIQSGNSDNADQSNDGDTTDKQRTLRDLSDDDWVKGNPDASVVLIEYGDFQCPACAQYFPVVQTLVEEFGDQVAFAYRHLPLTQVHPNAAPAAQASQAAGAQGKFWEMHDLLYERQASWSNLRNPQETFIGYAGELELDTEQFEDDYNSSAARRAVSESVALANILGLRSTPTFTLNGEQITGPQGLEPFRQLLQEAIDESGI